MLHETADLDGMEGAIRKVTGTGCPAGVGDLMNLRTLIPVGALAMVLGAGGLPAEAGQRDSHGRDRNGRESQGQIRGRNGGDAQARERRGAQSDGQDRGGARAQRDERGAQRDGGQDRGGRYQAPAPRAYERAERRDDYRNDRRYDVRPAPRYDGYRRYGYAPRIVPGRQRHYYGPGGNFSVYFGLGNGYRYGSPWSGRVYGYVPPRAYGVRIYYGDVRLQVRPRDAAVYVDGYYAGVVDDFDGVFQRLTLEVGPHQIELDAPGLEPQVFDIYVDPARTVDIRTDLFR
jgi:hypothetical protein